MFDCLSFVFLKIKINQINVIFSHKQSLGLQRRYFMWVSKAPKKSLFLKGSLFRAYFDR